MNNVTAKYWQGLELRFIYRLIRLSASLASLIHVLVSTWLLLQGGEEKGGELHERNNT